MRTFEFNDFEEAYPALIKALLEEGEEVSPRGMLTKEISPIGITINNPRNRVITNPVRKLNYGFMVGELLWMLQAKNDVSIAHYNKQWLNYSDDGKTLNGAYGQRIFNWDAGCHNKEVIYEDECNSITSMSLQPVTLNQFELAYEQLKSDPDTRQATIVLFNPYQDYRETKDKPCTNLLRFTIRKGKLNMMVVMRSNDIWFGFPYDVYNFTMMQEIMAGKLGIEVGKYTHVADSFHIYEMHFEAAKELINTPYTHNHIAKDARIPQDEYQIEWGRVFNIEIVTRQISNVVDLAIVIKMLSGIQNDYLRSIAAVIATYNFKKAKRSNESIEAIKEFIQNEFKGLL